MKYISKGNEYFVDEEFISWLHKEWKGYVVVIGGPSGVGKTTLSEKLGYAFVQSFTTRDQRKQYETYDFITHEKYKDLAINKAFATGVKFGTRDKYGVTKQRFKEAAKDNDVLIITMSPIGYRLLKSRYSKTIGVFVTADYKVVLKRLLKRDGELDEVRVSSYNNNMRSKGFYHIHVKNNHNFSLRFNVLKVRLLISLIKHLDKSKKGKNLRKKWFSVLKDNMFSKQSKTRARHRKKRKMAEQVRKEVEANQMVLASNVELVSAVENDKTGLTTKGPTIQQELPTTKDVI